MAEDSTRQGHLEKTCCGLRPTTEHNGDDDVCAQNLKSPHKTPIRLMCLWVCVLACVRVCMYVCVCVCARPCVHACVRACVPHKTMPTRFIRIRVFVWGVCAQNLKSPHETPIRLMCMWVCVCACVLACMCVYVCVFVCVYIDPMGRYTRI